MRLDHGISITATFCWPEGLADNRIVDGQNFINDRSVDGKSKNGRGVILIGYGLDNSVAGGASRKNFLAKFLSRRPLIEFGSRGRSTC